MIKVATPYDNKTIAERLFIYQRLVMPHSKRNVRNPRWQTIEIAASQLAQNRWPCSKNDDNRIISKAMHKQCHFHFWPAVNITNNCWTQTRTKTTERNLPTLRDITQFMAAKYHFRRRCRRCFAAPVSIYKRSGRNDGNIAAAGVHTKASLSLFNERRCQVEFFSLNIDTLTNS